ncbi:FecCD family ABC transporter permease [Azorhizobium oxalatiphilum]|uniref:FecCD family ABC transporter permease n=1 Tax=Azorhizobium oxalatiphilum TaxID=980631 RepID=UPI001FCE4AD8|nr:iron ABC transporter permease [Azorhizobium oxalatiphilum]
MSQGLRVSVLTARRRRRLGGLALGLLLLAFGALVSLAVGSRAIPLADTLEALVRHDPRNDLHLIVRELRIPRTLVAILAGGALGVAGAIMQAATRNPLAEPGLLGINAGAALAVIIGVSAFGLVSMAHYVLFATLGAGLAGVAVFLLGRAHETGTNPVRLVLAGAGLSVVLGSITGVIIVNAPPTVYDDFRHWASGSMEGRDFGTATGLAICVALGLAVVLPLAGSLNAMALGRDLGQALGTNVRATWLLACLAVMLLVGAATAGAGPIVFVGLVTPYVARMVVGPDYRWILPYGGLFAAILLLGADILGRVLAAPAEVPAGIVALLVGGPFFLIVVRRFRLRTL